jgi:hypothetical protein
MAEPILTGADVDALAAKQKAERIAWIDSAPLLELLRKWRFSPGGDPFFVGEVGEHYKKVLFGKQQSDPIGWSTASRMLG